MVRFMAIKRKSRLGRVVSDKMDKTVVVAVDSVRHHPLYKKAVRRTVKYKAHDEKNECGPGDIVRLVETRPLSREKRWRVAEIVSKAEVIEVKPEEIEELPEEPMAEPEKPEVEPGVVEAKAEATEAELEEAKVEPEEKVEN